MDIFERSVKSILDISYEPLHVGSHVLSTDTVGNTDGSSVDGINLDEIKEFAKQFKIRRLSLGLTQTQVNRTRALARKFTHFLHTHTHTHIQTS